MLIHPTPSGKMMYTATIRLGSGPHGLAHARGAHGSLHHAIDYGVLSGGGIPNPHLMLREGWGLCCSGAETGMLPRNPAGPVDGFDARVS